MGGRDGIELEKVIADGEEAAADLLKLPMNASSAEKPESIRLQKTKAGVVVGELSGMTNEGLTPLIRYPGQPGTAAIAARTVVELHGSHIGRPVVLMFEEANPSRPIIMG